MSKSSVKKATPPKVDNRKTQPPKLELNKKQDDRYVYMFAGLAAIAYYLISFKSTGFYQHDEIAHYINMIDFWKDPKIIMSNFAKPGYKLFYVLPAMLGENFLKIYNVIFASLSCVLVYKIARIFDSRFAYLSFFLIALQPYWIQLSFRNYADSFSGLMLIAGLYAHYKGKFPISTLIISYLFTVRQEFAFLLAFYGIWLLWNKKFICVLLGAVFPLLYGFAGFLISGDPLWLINDALLTSASVSAEFPKLGFDNFFKMSAVIWNAVITTLLVLFFVTSILRKTTLFDKQKFLKDYPGTSGYKSAAFIVVCFLVYFLFHCMLNLKAKTIFMGGTGNLRYMAAVAPCVALLAIIGLDRLAYIKKVNVIIGALIVFSILVGLFQCYDHNNIVFDMNTRNWNALFITIATSIAVLTLKKPIPLTYTLIVLMLLFDITSIKLIKMSEEDKSIIRVSKIPLIQEAVMKDKIYTNHIFFKYNFYKINPSCTVRAFDSTIMSSIPVGSIVIWDSHYSFRPRLNPKHLPLTYFNTHANEFALHQNFISTDRRFQAAVFQKVK